MKKRVVIWSALLCAALLCAHDVHSQHYVGLKGGYGAAYGRLRTVWGKSQSSMMWDKYTAGVMWRYYSPQRVVGGFQAELEYQQRAYRTYNGLTERGENNVSDVTAIVSDTTSYRAKTRTVSTVSLPLIWQPHLYMFKQHLRLFLSAGIMVNYNTGWGDRYRIEDYVWSAADRVQTRTLVSDEPYRMQTARDMRWNYGWLGGAGFGVLFDRWEIFAEGRYYFGMSDIMRNDSKYRFNTERTLRSELDNIYITVGVFFRLGKGNRSGVGDRWDVDEPPRKKRRSAPIGDAFKNIKIPR